MNASLANALPALVKCLAEVPFGRFRSASARSAGVGLGFCLLAFLPAQAQFLDQFEDGVGETDLNGEGGWTVRSGDGEAVASFDRADGIGMVRVDARQDRRNVWWAILRRDVTPYLDKAELQRPGRELRIEARIRSSAAPRRVNLHFNHSRTEDFHAFLMEYDIPDTENWHTVSFTTEGFEVESSDDIYAQLALMDWGRSEYLLEVDYVKVEVVDPAQSGPDLGRPLPYRPPPPLSESLAIGLMPKQAAIVDSAYPNINFGSWKAASDPEQPRTLAVSGTQTVVLRWDFGDFVGAKPEGWGVLELTTHSVGWAETGLEEFGELRLVEILGGDAEWQSESVSYESLLADSPSEVVFNGQMVVDTPPARQKEGKTALLVSPPVLERLFSGKTKGLAIYPQGALVAAFYAGAAGEESGPVLRFNLAEKREPLISVDFEGHHPGRPYGLASWDKDGFPLPSWGQGFGGGRVVIDQTSPRPGSTRHLSVTFPEGGVGPSETGAQASLELEAREEYFISYWLRFEEGFSWGGENHGGKLPGLAAGGLCSGGEGCDGTNGFTARLMWRRDGRAVLYLYHMDKPQVYGEDFPLTLPDGEEVRFAPGKWMQVAQRVRINSGTSHDGEIDMWIDGQHALSLTGLRFVTNGDLIDQLFFSTFHGGNDPSWAPLQDSRIHFDDFRVGESLQSVLVQR